MTMVLMLLMTMFLTTMFLTFLKIMFLIFLTTMFLLFLTTLLQESVIESSGPVFGSSTAQTEAFNFTALAAGAEGEQGFQTAQEGFR